MTYIFVLLLTYLLLLIYSLFFYTPCYISTFYVFFCWYSMYHYVKYISTSSTNISLFLSFQYRIMLLKYLKACWRFRSRNLPRASRCNAIVALFLALHRQTRVHLPPLSLFLSCFLSCLFDPNRANVNRYKIMRIVKLSKFCNDSIARRIYIHAGLFRAYTCEKCNESCLA